MKLRHIALLALVFLATCSSLFAASPGYQNFDTWYFNIVGGLTVQINTNNIATRAWVTANFSGGGGGGSGSVTNFHSGNLSPLFTTSVASPTTNPTLSYTLNTQSANSFFAGPTSGGVALPTFRPLVTTDLPFSIGNLTDAGVDGISVTGGTGSIIGSGVSLSQHIADATHNGYLGTADWNAFNNKQGPLAFGNLTAAGTDGIAVTGGSGAVIGSGTSIAQHVADATHSGYLSLTDWNTFNNKGSGTLTGITNASLGLLGFSLLSSSNPPVPSLKSISAGGNVTITDNGTNLIFSAANSGGGASGIDLSQTNMPAFDGATNFYVDFNWPAQTLAATGAIYFNYSTNWGLANTSRVARLYIAPTNYFRHVYFVNSATNWHAQPQTIWGVPCGFGATIRFSIYGQGDTNVTLEPLIDNTITGTNWLNVGGFCPTNSQGGCVLWLESSQGTYLDENSVSPAPVGTQVKAWTDLSLFVPRMTNQNAANFVYVTTPNITPGNVPSLHWTSGGGANFLSTGFANLAQPNWAFVVWYGRGNNFTWVDGLSEGNRFGCVIGEGLLNRAGAYSGTSVSMTNTPEIAWKLFTWSQNGASSVIRTNGALGLTANTGTQTPSRWSIGSDYNQAAFTGDGYAAEVLIYHTNMTALQVTNIENYLMNKYGIRRP